MKHAAAVGAALAITLTGATAGVFVPSASAATVTLPSYSAIVNSTKLAANYYRTTYAHTTVTPTNGWSWSTYTQGVLALFGQAGDQRFLNDDLAWGRTNAWGISSEIDPDRLTAAQVYNDLAALDRRSR